MKKVLIVLMLIVSSLASANTYYVSPSGNNSNSGSIIQPWLTWKKAFQTAVAGDTVYFRGGVYYVKSTGDIGGMSNSGTAENPICYFNYPGEAPILDGSKLNVGAYTYPVNASYRDYIEIDSLTVRNFVENNTGDIIYAFQTYKSEHITITNCKAYNISGIGFGIYGSNEVYVTNCDAWNLCDSLAVHPGQNGVGFQWNMDMTLFPAEDMLNAHIYFEGCRTWDFSDNGFAGPGHGYVEINNCWVWNGGRLHGEGCGFKFTYGSGSDTANVLSRFIHNCIAADNGNYGFSTNNNGYHALNVHCYNNFSYHNGYKHNLEHYSRYFGVGFELMNYTDAVPAPHELYANNISYANEYMNYWEQDGYNDRYNSWNTPPGVTISSDDFVSLDTAELRWSRKADGSLPNIGFGKLAPGSDLIDAGIDVGLQYNGQAPDLGWSEVSSNVVTPVTPVLISSAIQNATPSKLEMTYNLTLANIVPAASAFTINVNSVAIPVNTVAISGTKVLLTFTNPIVHDDVVIVAYTKPASNPLQTASGGQASSVSAQNVTNNVTAIIANQLPIVNLSSPTKSTSFIAPASITIDAVAYDPDGTINKVEFYNSITKLGERTTIPYSYTWKEVPEGTYSITAVAYDNQNAKTISPAVSVTVLKSATAINQKPVVSIKSPNNGKKYNKHDNIVIEVVASDPDGIISTVELKNGSFTLAEMTTAPYLYTLQDADTGTYLLTAVATDNSNANSTSSVVEMTVEDFYDADSEFINLYPNPNNGHFTINLFSNLLTGSDSRITIFSLSGKTVYYDILTGQENSKEFDLSNATAGTYFLMLTRNNIILTTKKFIKN